MSFGERTSRILLSTPVLRIGSIFTTLFGISIFVFLVLRVIPGDSIVGAFGIETGVLTPEQIAQLKIYYGIDKSLPMQYILDAEFLDRQYGIFIFHWYFNRFADR